MRQRRLIVEQSGPRQNFNYIFFRVFRFFILILYTMLSDVFLPLGPNVQVVYNSDLRTPLSVFHV